MADMDRTFAEIIKPALYGRDVSPGDVIGLEGAIGTGCFLELNGTKLLDKPGYQGTWLQPGDIVI